MSTEKYREHYKNLAKTIKILVFAWFLYDFISFSSFFLGCAVKSCKNTTVHSKFDDDGVATGVFPIFFHAHIYRKKAQEGPGPENIVE